MDFLLKKLLPSARIARVSERPEANTAQDTVQSATLIARCSESDLCGSADAGPCVNPNYILDPDLFPEAIHAPKMQQRSLRYPVAAPTFPPGLPVPMHLQTQLLQPMAGAYGPYPIESRVSARRMHCAGYNVAGRMLEAEVEDSFRDLAPNLQALNETQLIKVRKFICYYQLKYNLASQVLRAPIVCDEDRIYFAQHLSLSSECVRTSRCYFHQRRVRHHDALVKARESRHLGENIVRAFTRTKEAITEIDGQPAVTCPWSAEVLEYKKHQTLKTAQQVAIKAQWGDDFEVDDYAWRSARSRKAWLLRSERKLQDKANKRRDSHENEGDTGNCRGGQQQENALRKAEKRSSQVQSLAARRLHSSLSSEEMKMLPATWRDENVATIDAAKERTVARDVITPLPRKVLKNRANITLGRDGNGDVGKNEHFDIDEHSSGDAEHEDEAKAEVENSIVAGQTVATAETSTARMLSLVKAKAKPNMRAVQRSAGKDSVMPGMVK